MKARDESGILNKDFPEKSTDWIATDCKRCTDAIQRVIQVSFKIFRQNIARCTMKMDYKQKTAR